MTLPSYNRFSFLSDPPTRADLELFQQFLEEMLSPLLESPGNDNVFLQNLSVGTTDTVISHKLGRLPQGYRVVRLDTNAVVWESAAATTQFLTLRASAACIVSLEVF